MKVELIRPLGYPVLAITVKTWRPVYRHLNRLLAVARRGWEVTISDRDVWHRGD